MDFKQIQGIIKDFENSNITNLEIEMDAFKIKLNKNSVIENEVLPVKSVKNKASVEVEETDEQTDEQTFQVKSPLIGTFYVANSPKDEPFVTVGKKVKKGDTLCIIEAMKIMNEITAPTDGIIDSITVKNGEAIGFEQVLMKIL